MDVINFAEFQRRNKPMFMAFAERLIRESEKRTGKSLEQQFEDLRNARADAPATKAQR